MTRNSDEGAIVLGWLTKLVLTLAVLGFLAYDGVSLVAANFSASDRANTLASEAADDMHANHDINATYAAIKAEAEAGGDTLPAQDFQVAGNGNVTLVLQRHASSLWMKSIGPLKKYLLVSASGSGAPPS